MDYSSIEDLEDHAQEKLVAEWLKKTGQNEAIDLKYINRNGNVRSSRVKASLSLDQPIVAGETGSFSEIIQGSDGRDLEETEEPPPEPNLYFEAYLSALGFNKGEQEWLIKALKLSLTQNEQLSLTSQNDSELWEL